MLCNIMADERPFEHAEKLRYLGKKVTDQNVINADVKSKLILDHANCLLYSLLSTIANILYVW
jgi:hypothetical protein